MTDMVLRKDCEVQMKERGDRIGAVEGHVSRLDVRVTSLEDRLGRQMQAFQLALTEGFREVFARLDKLPCRGPADKCDVKTQGGE